MLTGQTGHSSPDAALSRQAGQWALSFRTLHHIPPLPGVHLTNVTSQSPTTPGDSDAGTGGCTLSTVTRLPEKEKKLDVRNPLPFPWQNQSLLREAVTPTRHYLGFTEQGQTCAPLAPGSPSLRGDGSADCSDHYTRGLAGRHKQGGRSLRGAVTCQPPCAEGSPPRAGEVGEGAGGAPDGLGWGCL